MSVCIGVNELFAQVKKKNHPLLLLSGIATNAIGYDLSPEVSLFFTKNIVQVETIF